MESLTTSTSILASSLDLIVPTKALSVSRLPLRSSRYLLAPAPQSNSSFLDPKHLMSPWNLLCCTSNLVKVS
jgi:hypothetical protein